MKEDDKLIDAIINLGVAVNMLKKNMGGITYEMKGLRADINFRLQKLEKQQQRTNLALGEMRLSYMKVANGISGMRNDFNNFAIASNVRVNGHEKRINKLERMAL